jgi:virulence-associated protein VagC
LIQHCLHFTEIPPYSIHIIMDTATVTSEGDCQTVRLPKGYRLSTTTVTVRHDGEAIILEPMKSQKWPPGFFDSIHITDPAFARPDQGKLPPVKSL